jgi:TPP-dependent pyruvate/acetoin dehydrogenase alpha subunit
MMSEINNATLPNRDIQRQMLKTMYEIRYFEEALYHAFMTEKMPGTMHQAIGMEAVPTGVAFALHEDDQMTSTHRGHGHAIAKGVPIPQLMAEMYAKSTGTSKGLGGSLHVFDRQHGFLGTTGIVGAGVPIGVGAALAAKLEGKGRVVVAFFGDGASNQGAVHEALNMAAIWKLPVLFVCENNRYAVSMPVQRATAIDHIADRAAAYGMHGETIDGMDVLKVYGAAKDAVEHARVGDGPTLLECETYRYKGHSRFEPAKYRPEGELEVWITKDPINHLRGLMIEQNILSETEADILRDEVEALVQEAITFAKNSPSVTIDLVPSLIFAEQQSGRDSDA